MQEKVRRTNAERSRSTREALLEAARTLFVTAGYAATGTPEIVKTAAVTRGALYHHFADKAALFEGVVRQEAQAVANAIAAATAGIVDPRQALEAGADAFLDAMAVEGRTRLLLIDGPAVLGREAMERIDRETASATLLEGIAQLAGREADEDIRVLASMLSSAFDRAALDIVGGADDRPYRRQLKKLLSTVPAILAQ